MNVRVLMIGKTNDNYIREGVSEFLGRLKHYLKISWDELPDIKDRKNLSPQQIKEKETNLLLTKLPEKFTLVLLDEKGKEYTSMNFAEFITKQAASGIKELVFVIGGAYGVSEELKKRADFALSLSQMTFTHQLIRLIFAEQLYRAMTITRNEPYHNE
jgi:23S rRNA (pseudouridine1915-N3)-methyltransferase